MKFVSNSDEFREYMLKELQFKPMKEMLHYIYYKNIYEDEYHYYYRKHCYEFGIANYTVTHNFNVDFSNHDCLIRFGIVYKGTSLFQLKDKKIDSFQPSAFFVMEEAIEGRQAWRKNQHFHGIEITIYKDYFNKVVEELTGNPFDFSLIELNHTYHYLSNDMIQAIQQLQAIAISGDLNPVYLESRILEFIALLCNETPAYGNHSSFLTQENSIPITSGKRVIRLSPSELSSIRKAHAILTDQYVNPPSVEDLSQLVLISSQKLTLGFQHQYHQSIHKYIITLRMAASANLLCTTNLHIQEIAEKVGYSHPGNFIKIFKKYYGKTPLQYRMLH